MTPKFLPGRFYNSPNMQTYEIAKFRTIRRFVSDSMGYLCLAIRRNRISFKRTLVTASRKTMMFSYRGLLLTVTIPLASIVLADVLVQPRYEHHDSNLKHQAVLQIHSPTEQYRANQLPESTGYTSRFRTMYPYAGSYESNAGSNLLSYRPSYHHYHYSPRPHHHFAKIGGHGYVRPSVYVGSPLLLQKIHDVRKRSDRSDPSTESNKSETVAHDNDVATKSPLTDTKHPTAIDSLLPEHEPTDTNDKRVESRQIPFEFYPEKYQLALTQNTMRNLFPLTNDPSSNQPPNQYETYNDNLATNNPSARVQSLSHSFEESESETDNRSKFRYADGDMLTFRGVLEAINESVLKHLPGLIWSYTSYLLKDKDADDSLKDKVADDSLKDKVADDSLKNEDDDDDDEGAREKGARAAYKEFAEKFLQEITNMDTINMAMPRQDGSKIPTVPSTQNPNQPIYFCNTGEVSETSRVGPQPSNTENQYHRKPKKLLNPNDLIDSLSVQIGKGPHSHHVHYYPEPDSDKYAYYGTYFDTNKKSANSADSTNRGQFPVIPASEYVLHTSFNTWPRQPSIPFPWNNQQQTNSYNYPSAYY